MFFLPSLKKIRCCLCSLFLISIFVFISFRLGPDIWKNFYNIESLTKNLPGIGSTIELNEAKVTIQRIERIPNQQNPQSDFETLLVELTIESKLPINKLIFDVFDIWVEDKYGNKYEFSTTDRRNQILEESEVIPKGALQIKAYFSVPKYTNELYLLVKPKIGGNPIKIQL